MKEVLLAGTHSGVGKTTVTLALIQALINRDFQVQAYKVGPDYVDTAFHSHLTKRESYNLDAFMIEDKAVLTGLYYQGFQGADLAVTEGVMGLFDGLGTDPLTCSSSGLALNLDIPVLLIIDGSAQSTSAAALVKGFADLEPRLNFIGVLVNRVVGEGHYQLIKKAIEQHTQLSCLGYMVNDKNLELPSQKLGLLNPREIAQLEKKIKALANSLEKTVDLDEIIKRMKETRWIPQAAIKTSEKLLADFHRPETSSLTLAYAQDEAFCFHYPQNLSLLRKKGVELIPFSPLHDKCLPAADGYYFAGGYPSTYAKLLSENNEMKVAIRKAYLANKAILVEGESLIYFSESYRDNQASYPMLGIFKGQSYPLQSLKYFGYTFMEVKVDTPLAKAGQVIKGHEFHYSDFEAEEEAVADLYKVRDGQIIKRRPAGFLSRRCFASFLQTHLYQDPQVIENGLQFLRKKATQGDR